MLYFLLGVIAVGVLLMSDAGKALLGSAVGLAMWFLVMSVLFFLGVVGWEFLVEHKVQAEAFAGDVIYTFIGLGILWWLANKEKQVQAKPDNELGPIGQFVRKTSVGGLVLYIIAGIILLWTFEAVFLVH